ncbi:motility hub protein FimV [Dermacentor silvarum]|uniref:motility hub protein FimV n=1 Tax=Dermacentor silvarum TaxID=543639 RepID=UPI0018989CC7|nr:motility hub protein FimV [Dermacentor silvarum]
MADATMVTGYDPTSLRVVTMETTSSDQAMPSEHEYLADMVKLWQRKQSQAAAPPKGQGSRAATLPQKPAGPPTAAPVVKPVDHQPSPRATPTPRTPPAPPASSTAPAAQSVTGAPQSPLSIDHTLPLEDRITRLENVVLYQISTINVQYIVAEVVQAVQAWALTQFRTRSSRSRSASTSSSSAPRRRKVAGSSSPALNPASIPLPAPQGMEDDP